MLLLLNASQAPSFLPVTAASQNPATVSLSNKKQTLSADGVVRSERDLTSPGK